MSYVSYTAPARGLRGGEPGDRGCGTRGQGHKNPSDLMWLAARSNLIPLKDVVAGFAQLGRICAVGKLRKPREMQLRNVMLMRMGCYPTLLI